jgi:VWFA-related protein
VCLVLLSALLIAPARPAAAAGPVLSPRDASPRDAGQARPAASGAIVTLPVSVTREGASVRGLTEADFSVTEDGQPLPLHAFSGGDIPLSLAIIVDTGPMMRGPWMSETFSAVRQLLADVLGPDDEACLYVFAREPLLLQKWAQKDTLLTSRYQVPEGAGAPLFDALTRATTYMDQARHPRRALLVVTGGSTSDGWRRTVGPAFAPPQGRGAPPSPTLNMANPWEPSPEREKALKELKARALLFYPIGLETPRPSDKKVEPPPPLNTQELRELSEESGGYLQLVPSPDQLGEAVAKLRDELRSQYLVSYVSPRGDDGKYHEVRVAVKQPECRVRARQGYMAAKGKR